MKYTQASISTCVFWFLLFWTVVATLTCAGQNRLHNVCVRYVDTEGYLRGRYATYNDAGAKANEKRNPLSHEGFCDPNTQGDARKIFVCILGPCGYDITLSVQEDEAAVWVGAGGSVGKCEATQKIAGDCRLRLSKYNGPEDFQQREKWMKGRR